MKKEKSCDNCIYSIPDWINVCNSDHYCSNEESEEYGYNAEYLNGCDEWKSIEPNLSNNGSIYTKTGVNDEDRITDDLISRQAVMKEFSDFVRKSNNSDFAPTPTWNDAVSLVGSMPSAQPTQTNADSTHENTLDCVSRQDVLKILSSKNAAWDAYDKVKQLPSAQPEIIHCCDCAYYDPEHIENNGVRYEYKDMPKDAFDVLGTGLVNAEYGVNVGGRCCRDYNGGYSEDKRVFVSEQNYCGRAWRKRDE